MKQTLNEIFKLSDLIQTRKLLAKVGLGLSFLPGIIFILYNLLTNIGGPNPFLIVIIFFAGLPTVAIGLIIYLFADNKLKRKLALTVLTVIFQLSILPILWVINDIKLSFFLLNNKTELELIATNLIDNKWTFEQANDYTEKSGIEIKLTGHIEEDETVLFTLSGFIDNTHGVAYSRTGKEAYRNVYGHIAKLYIPVMLTH